MPKSFRAGVDIGGTFTDIVLLGDDGSRYTKKVSSTVDDYARAIVDGLAALLAMLNSCASNVTVVNIDNGFGAGFVASLINRKRD